MVIWKFTFLVLCTLFSSAFSNTKPCEEHDNRIMASITDYNLRHICSGVVLSVRWILTAAHCLINNPISVIVGHTLKSANTTKIFGIDTSYVSEDYKEMGSTNDIGLLKLSSPIVMDGSVEFVKMPLRKITTPLEEYCNSSTIVAKSWKLHSDFDSPDILQCVDLSIIPSETCVSQYKSAGHDIDSGKTICTESRRSKDACSGDAGGPIMCNGVQIGIVSWALDCDSPNIPGVFTRVDTYADSISAALKQRGSSTTPGWRLCGESPSPGTKDKSLRNLHHGYRYAYVYPYAPYDRGHSHLTIPNKILLAVVTLLASFAIIV